MKNRLEQNGPENRLAGETSPYLLQHKNNPAAWRPWDDAALAEARAADKPILLSVGYSACHWCHVMAHESFENPEIAALMNKHYVNIKVDREERPDLDTLYQTALAVMGEQGGWPLTMFLTPELEPFWGGTYFPPSPRFGRPAFPQILSAVAEAFANDPDKIQSNVKAVREAVVRAVRPETGGVIDRAALDAAAGAALRMIDPIHGGTQGAPKFPQVSLFQMLWSAHRRTGSALFKQAVTLTLDKISQGGIYDHVGGGFARYSTDALWLAPHFEKMLYDNALLMTLLTQVWAGTRSPLYAVRIEETAAWLLREMKTGPDLENDFAFASAYDADSEGEEGKFYVWSEAEIDAVLGAGEDAALFKQACDVSPEGNWEGHVILNRTARPELLSDADESRLAGCREKLFTARAGRTPPLWDDKVLADWNGLVIRALAEAGAALDRPEWIAAAETAWGFVERHMRGADGRLRHAWREGRANHPATVEDHANLARAALALHEVTGAAAYLEAARAHAAEADTHYWDAGKDGGKDGGEDGYFLAAADTPGLIERTKPVHDNAVPAGNGTMLDVLARLWLMTGETAYRERAEAVLAAFAARDAGRLAAQPGYMCAAELLSDAVQVVVVSGAASGENGGENDGDNDSAARDLIRAFHRARHPNGVLLRAALNIPEGHPAAGKGPVDGRAAAYVCRGPVCGAPVTDAEDLARALAGA
ncbi:MAG: thioredoxin domain-containing protein [Rhodospirillales bacterium]